MKPIRILTPDLQLLAEIDDYESLQFTRRWHEVGEFEIHINRYKQHTDKLVKGNLILLGSDTSKVGIIKHREISLDESGKQSEKWIVKGWELKGVTKQRIILPPSGAVQDKITDVAETVMKHFVNNHIVSPVDTNRAMSLVSNATDQLRGASLTWGSRYKNLADELSKISFSSGLGWKIYLEFSSMKWIFDVYEGKDLTTNQTVNPPVIFSPEFDSLKSQHYVDSDLNYKSFGYVGGQGEGTTRTIKEVGSGLGLDRIETFIDARDITDTELVSRGEQKLNEMSIEKLLEAQILPQSPFKYEQDYDLGDIVTIQNKGWNVTMDARITEIKEVYEPSGFQLEATFGNSFPTLISKIKQEFTQLEGEVTR